MNCHETRERLSDLLDLALAAPERAESKPRISTASSACIFGK